MQINDNNQPTRLSRLKQNFIVRHKVFFLTIAAMFALFLTISSVGAFMIAKKYNPEASMLKIQNMDKDIVQSLTIKDANNEDLVKDNVVIKYKQAKVGKNANVDNLYLQTLVDTEDNSFYTRHTKGYSIKGLAGAVASQVKAKITHSSDGRGGSTLEQQLAKIIVFGEGNANTVGDKIIQIIDARKLAEKYSRNEILEAYINQLHLTPSTIGVKAASLKLFNNDLSNIDKKDPKQVSQVAFLAGLGQSPTNYVDNFNTAGKSRTKVILEIMLENKLISQDVYNKSIKFVKSDQFIINKSSNSGIPKAYQSYVSEVKQEVSEMNLPSNSDISIKTFTTKSNLDQLYNIVTGQAESDSSIPLDYIEHKETLASISAVDTKTGHIIGLSTNSDNPQTSYVGNRSSGSTIKPLLDYAPALEYGKISAYSTMNGNAFTTQGWNVQNYGGYNYGNISAAKALGLSLNTAAVQAFEMTTQTEKSSIMSPLGLAAYNSEDNYNVVRSIDYPTNTLAMASAYSAIGNDGVRVSPTAIDSIDVNGKSYKKSTQDTQRAMSSSTAKNLTEMLQNVVESTGSEPYAAARYNGLTAGHYAVKSGLSSYSSSVAGSDTKSPDSWMAMTSPEISVSAWLGSPSYTDATYGVTSAPASQENNGRVYLLNNAIKTLMQGKTNSAFSWSGKTMSSSSTIKSAPTVNKLDGTSLSKFNPKNPKISKKKQKEYDEMQDKKNEQQDRVDSTYTGK